MKKLLMITLVLLAQLGFSQFPPDDKKFSMPEIPAEYIGGESAMITFMADNIKMPADAPSGTSYISFLVDEKGDVASATVIRGYHAAADEEALRVVKLLKFKPAIKDGKAIDYRMVLPVKFIVPEKKDEDK
jgi:protein TonB